MDNVGIVVEAIDAAIAFITELGLALEGRAPIETAEVIDDTIARLGKLGAKLVGKVFQYEDKYRLR